MTDEEMAEEYKESKRHKSFRTDIGKVSIEYEAYLNNLKSAYLAGLKAGRPKWHKVADGDLPSIYTTVLDGNGDRVERDEHGKWQAYSEYYERYEEIDPPKVWCKIPKYKEVIEDEI